MMSLNVTAGQLASWPLKLAGNKTGKCLKCINWSIQLWTEHTQLFIWVLLSTLYNLPLSFQHIAFMKHLFAEYVSISFHPELKLHRPCVCTPNTRSACTNPQKVTTCHDFPKQKCFAVLYRVSLLIRICLLSCLKGLIPNSSMKCFSC